MSTVSERSKAVRGTKRECEACEVRFYDLARDPIVCPACGANYTPKPAAIVEARLRAASGGKTGWGSKSFRRPSVAPVAVPEEDAASPADAVAEDADEAVETVGPEIDTVLEVEPDDGDVSGLVDHDSKDDPAAP